MLATVLMAALFAVIGKLFGIVLVILVLAVIGVIALIKSLF